MAEFELLRPFWLLALLPLLFVVVGCWRRRRSGGAWENLIDQKLQPHVLEADDSKEKRWPLLLSAIGLVLGILVLAGPVWEKQPLPVMQATESQVVALDVSRSMDTTDRKPTRLARAKHKVRDLLQQSAGKQTALVVFSEVAYVVSPLTDDVSTLEAFLPAIETAVVPVQGSRLVPAIVKARELLKQSGNFSGSIVLITDATVTTAALKEARLTREEGYNVSVLAVATKAGDPLRLPDGSLLEDAAGNIAVTRLDEAGLSNLASEGGGVYRELSIDNEDIDSFAGITNPLSVSGVQSSEREVLQWKERGPWLLPLLLLFALPIFRRGLL